MATDKDAKPGRIGPEVAPGINGRPRILEPYQKVTVCLFYRQALWLDQVALAVREKTGKHVISRAELIRALVDRAARTLKKRKTVSRDFDKAVSRLHATARSQRELKELFELSGYPDPDDVQ